MKFVSVCYPFRFGDMGSGNWLLYQKFVRFFGTLWFSVTYFLPLFGFLKTYFYRKRNSNHSEISSEDNSDKFFEPEPELISEIDTDVRGKEAKTDSSDWFGVENSDKSPVFMESELKPEIVTDVEGEDEALADVSVGFVEEEKEEFCFSFKFPSYEEFSKNRIESGEPVCYEAIAKSYETFASSVEEPPSFNEGASPIDGEYGLNDDHVQAKAVHEEMPEGSTSGSCSEYSQEKSETTSSPFTGEKEQTVGGQKSLHGDQEAPDVEAKLLNEEVPEGSTSVSCVDYLQEKTETVLTPFTEENQQTVGHKSLHGDQEATDDVQLQEDFSDMDSDSGSFTSSALRSIMNRIIDPYSDGFLSDRDFGGEFEAELDMNEEKGEESKNDEMPNLAEAHVDNPNDNSSDEDEDEELTYTMEELGKIEQAHLKAVANLKSNFLSEKDFTDKNAEVADNEENNGKDNKLKSTEDWDSEDSNQLETLWEHQELIEQLKMELKKVRATGLPTILEESDESPKIMEDLKPWKISEKFQHADRANELHKFYKSYRERMRKFDILNYQKMYAIGFLQLKDPLQPVSGKNSSVPSAESLLTQNSWLPKRKKIGSDPMLKFLRELQCEVEVVYVGQMCLSWEILHWQYEKALELWESDPHGMRRYNEVAGEFQQFQVLSQRFIEDEAFQGPRVQNYVKNRCVHRNLLQVPLIREDSTKDKKKAIESEYAITSDMLIEILEESIRIFWRFVRADKDCSHATLKSRKRPRVELQDPADSDLLMEVQESLVHKEKKLKDLLRSGNCILKKFRKCQQEEDTDQVLYFFSQVDMKLVQRVLNMSRITTEQLLWCRNKLNKISFVNRKLQVEPTFLLFPC